ncbi:hypothetical protein [uncultured Christiangramia sp.]|uniref:hypothetical protein n=1 Tax=uncultured Christiangramia sp. TaxID=503836 RepID=UPI0026200116|nr:hypothetical protein [uncultured Christiangramia sp.]
MYRSIITLFISFSISLNVIGQDLNKCGLDNKPTLTKEESEFLNKYMYEKKKIDFDFTNKKVIFITGTSGQKLGTKSDYFKNIKAWNEKEEKIATWIVELNNEEKIKSGDYDLIITYWVKYFSKNKKRDIINTIKETS